MTERILATINDHFEFDCRNLQEKEEMIVMINTNVLELFKKLVGCFAMIDWELRTDFHLQTLGRRIQFE